MLNGAKRVADSIRDLLSAARDLAEHPNDPKYIERFLAAQRALQAATSYLLAANKNNLADDPSQELLLMSAKNIAAAVEELLSTARNKNENNAGVMQWVDLSKRADEELQGKRNRKIYIVLCSIYSTSIGTCTFYFRCRKSKTITRCSHGSSKCY